MADHFIKKKHVSNISSRSISVFLPSDKVEVSKNKPIHIGWDLNVFKPVKEQTFALSSARAINTCQDPTHVIMQRNKLHAQTEIIAENFMARKERAFLGNQNPPEAPLEGRKSKASKFKGQMFFRKGLSKESFFVSCR
jgi:hypothetical protein